MAGRTILVTGASSGIGHETSRRLLAAGARVVGVGRSFIAGPAPEPGKGFVPVGLDLGRLGELPEALEKVAADHPEIDGVVASAGSGRFGSLEEHSPAQIRSLVDLNLTSQILLARVFLPRLKRRGRGDLLFVGSEAALHAGRRGAVYSATKFALRGLAEALRQECAKSGVRVSILHPGMVRTEFFEALAFEPGPEAEHALSPGDVACAILHVLASPAELVYDEIRLTPLKKSIHFKHRSSGES